MLPVSGSIGRLFRIAVCSFIFFELIFVKHVVSQKLFKDRYRKELKIKKPSRQVRKAYMINYIFAVSYLSFPTRAGLNVAPYLT